MPGHSRAGRLYVPLRVPLAGCRDAVALLEFRGHRARPVTPTGVRAKPSLVECAARRASRSGDQFTQPLYVGGDSIESGCDGLVTLRGECVQDPAAYQRRNRYVELSGHL